MYPYHLGGYEELAKIGDDPRFSTSSFGVRRKALGITNFLPIAIFSYFFSYKNIGIVVLLSSIVCIFIGSQRRSKFVHFGFTGIAILITLIAGVNMNNYEIINFVLE